MHVEEKESARRASLSMLVGSPAAAVLDLVPGEVLVCWWVESAHASSMSASLSPCKLVHAHAVLLLQP